MAEKYPNQTPDQTKEPNRDQAELAAKDDLLDMDQLQRLTLDQVGQDSNLQIAQNAAAAHPGVTTIQQNITIENQYNVSGGQTIVTGDQTNTIGDRGHISPSAGT
ncbi:uncharacterized protein [Amphiura filiformis]|uniref:uncharacterized protein n=1 Tax=Amphiura filiformis TaxID=82378 RepID=UPI003B211A94